jgi:L-seryl-tRNA(Ser) seleniumtransferase
MSQPNPLKLIPSVDKLLSSTEFRDTIGVYGHTRTSKSIREYLATLRSEVRQNHDYPIPAVADIAVTISTSLDAMDSSSLQPVLNLTGTVLHTNLGRAALPASAMEAVARTASGNANLEFDLSEGKRGDRDDHVERLLCELTGAEAVTVVNNNAAAVLICLNTFAFGKEVCISRGELVEIGGSFRIPEVMEKSGCTLRELGATNRTHLKDYANAINEHTGLLMKVHTSNYEIRGFTQEVSYEEVSRLAKERDVPFLADLGSGTLVNLENYGLAHEPTVQEVLKAGTDVVTFSGDKLLGGPQSGIIAGRKELIDQVKNNPLKRALRVDKMTMAALSEVLKLYKHPEALIQELPTIRHLARQPEEIRDIAETVLPAFVKSAGDKAAVSIIPSSSQIGSGALPLDQLSSFSIQIKPIAESDSALQQLARAFREMPVPVVGRLHDGALLFDVRTLDESALLIDQLKHFVWP